MERRQLIQLWIGMVLMTIGSSVSAQIVKDTIKPGDPGTAALSHTLTFPPYVKTVSFDLRAGGGAAHNLSPGAGHGSGGAAHAKIRYQVCAGDTFMIYIGSGGDPDAVDADLRDGGWTEVKKKVGTQITNEYRVEGGKGAEPLNPGQGGKLFIEDTYIGGLPATVLFTAIGGDGGYATNAMGDPIMTTGGLMDPGARGGGGGGSGGPGGSC
ncbi:MAG TPA: hypothetical protein PKC30_05470, partial [Saprospiraceae bacterium]|nr:hypothetical protein [Saprospiraceae bacterium]